MHTGCDVHARLCLAGALQRLELALERHDLGLAVSLQTSSPPPVPPTVALVSVLFLPRLHTQRRTHLLLLLAGNHLLLLDLPLDTRTAVSSVQHRHPELARLPAPSPPDSHLPLDELKTLFDVSLGLNWVLRDEAGPDELVNRVVGLEVCELLPVS